MASLNEFLAQIEDGKAVRVALAMLDTGEKERFACVYNALESPRFGLSFLTGALPVERVDRNRTCVVLFDVAGQSVSVAAEIETIPNRQTMRLSGRELIDHEQLREFFRVDVVTPVKAACLIPTCHDDPTYRLSGETVDVSGNGMLVNFNEPLEMDSLLKVELVLPPAGDEVVQLVGRVVRCVPVGEDRFQIALFFEEVESEVRDKIMACCFKIQRSHLRMRVRVKD